MQLLSFGLALAAFSTDAPVPIAAGSLQGVLEVVAAAKACKLGELRISLYEHPYFGEARVYLIDRVVEPQAETCLMTWIAKNGERLKLTGYSK